MQNILLLTDFSKNANNAIEYAMQLFCDKPSSFFILNVQKVSKYITSDLTSSPYKTVHDAITKNPKNKLDVLIDDLRLKYANEDYSIEGICDYDSFISSVKQVVAIKQIDIIVMGTNGISGFKEALFGSNTIQIIKKVDLPILVIPDNYKFLTLKTILFINEKGIEISKKILKPLTHIITKFNSQLDILTINDDLRDKGDELLPFFKNVSPNFYNIENKSIENKIQDFISKKNTQLVAKIINTESFFKRIFSESNTASLTYASKVPLLFL